MKVIGKMFPVLLVLLPVTVMAAGSRKAISIDEVLRLAAINSPRLTAAQFREIAAAKSVDIARATYFPTLSAEAIDSTGFAGSSGLIGVGGLMGSPYRSGASGGLVAEQTIWDFGRTYYDVEASRHEVEFSRQDTRVTLYQVKQLALQTYYECAFDRSQSEVWGRLVGESGLITREAQHFVNTGQVSIVDRYLSSAQTEEAKTAQAFYTERLKKAEQELAVIMGVPAGGFTCPVLPGALTSTLNPDMGIEYSPVLRRAMAGAKAARARMQQQEANFYPKIVAVASAGGMEDARLVTKQDYAAGIGLIWPLFDMHTSGEIQRAKAVASEKNHEVAAEKLYLQEMNAKYDNIIQSAKVRLKHLDAECIIADKAFSVAKKRYFSLEGTLIDLREAFRNLSRVLSEIQETQTRYLQASGSKALLNGSGD